MKKTFAAGLFCLSTICLSEAACYSTSAGFSRGPNSNRCVILSRKYGVPNYMTCAIYCKQDLYCDGFVYSAFGEGIPGYFNECSLCSLFEPKYPPGNSVNGYEMFGLTSCG